MTLGDARTAHKGKSDGTIIAGSFDDSNRPYDAVTKLQEPDQRGQVRVDEARVVERSATGQLVVKESVRGTADDTGIARRQKASSVCMGVPRGTGRLRAPVGQGEPGPDALASIRRRSSPLRGQVDA